MNAGDRSAEAYAASLSAADAMARERCETLAAALRQWKCPSCGGDGIYQPNKPTNARNTDPRRTPLVGDARPCKVCNQTGLHPIASAALAAAGAP